MMQAKPKRSKALSQTVRKKKLIFLAIKKVEISDKTKKDDKHKKAAAKK